MDTLLGDLGDLTPKESIPVTETISNIQDAVKDLHGATRAKALPIMSWIAKHASKRRRFMCKGEGRKAKVAPFSGASGELLRER